MVKKTTTRNFEIFQMVFASILIAIIILLTALPFGGYINLGIVQMTILHIPVMIGAILLGKRYGLLLGFVFGVGSLIRSFVEVLPQNAPFTNPLVSVLPRMFFGYITAVLYNIFSKKIKQKSLALGLTLTISTLIHTFTVVPLMYFTIKSGFLFYAPNNLESGFFIIIGSILLLNTSWEVLTALLIGIPSLLALFNHLRNY